MVPIELIHERRHACIIYFHQASEMTWKETFKSTTTCSVYCKMTSITIEEKVEYLKKKKKKSSTEWLGSVVSTVSEHRETKKTEHWGNEERKTKKRENRFASHAFWGVPGFEAYTRTTVANIRIVRSGAVPNIDTPPSKTMEICCVAGGVEEERKYWVN